MVLKKRLLSFFAHGMDGVESYDCCWLFQDFVVLHNRDVQISVGNVSSGAELDVFDGLGETIAKQQQRNRTDGSVRQPIPIGHHVLDEKWKKSLLMIIKENREVENPVYVPQISSPR